MAYSPQNNPYVPGDPYSYDLKWIVQRIKSNETSVEQAVELVKQAEMGAHLAPTVADFVNKDLIYVYTGSETGYTAGNWYYWNGSAWTSGGAYGSIDLNTDFIPAGNFESALGTTGIITITERTFTEAGIYLISATGYQTHEGYTTAERAGITTALTLLHLDSSNTALESSSQRSVLTGGGDCSVSMIINAAAGDKVALRWQQSVGASGATLTEQTMYGRMASIKLA